MTRHDTTKCHFPKTAFPKTRTGQNVISQNQDKLRVKTSFLKIGTGWGRTGIKRNFQNQSENAVSQIRAKMLFPKIWTKGPKESPQCRQLFRNLWDALCEGYSLVAGLQPSFAACCALPLHQLLLLVSRENGLSSDLRVLRID